MLTTLTIILAVLVVVNIWITIASTKQMRNSKRKLQERINEFNNASDIHIAEMQGAKHRVNEAIAETAKIKSNYEMLLKDHEEFFTFMLISVSNYEMLLKDHEELLQAYKELRKEYEHAQEHTISGDPHAGHQDPVNGGDVNVATTTAGEKPVKSKKNYKLKAK